MHTTEYRVAQAVFSSTFEPVAEPFIVPTPEPYVVDLKHWPKAEDKVATVAKLLEDCQVLYEVLIALGISVKEARAARYSLNRDTWIKLGDIAMKQNRADIANRIREL